MSLLFTYEMRKQHNSCSLSLFISESNVTKPNPHLYWLTVLSATGERKSQQSLVTPLAS